MKYTVVWKPKAEQQLADLWNQASDRNAITKAANLIDHVLTRDPHSQGESRWNSYRIMFAPPLAVYFDVSEADKLVVVVKVWKTSH